MGGRDPIHGIPEVGGGRESNRKTGSPRGASEGRDVDSGEQTASAGARGPAGGGASFGEDEDRAGVMDITLEERGRDIISEAAVI